MAHSKHKTVPLVTGETQVVILPQGGNFKMSYFQWINPVADSYHLLDIVASKLTYVSLVYM